MFYDQGCVGRVDLGPVPKEVANRLTAIPGDWLEFDPPSGAIVVRHVEPTSSRHLPAITFELVRLFSEIPAELHGRIPGGDLFVHTEDEKGQLVRIRVETGWHHPHSMGPPRFPSGPAKALLGRHRADHRSGGSAPRR